MAQRETIFFIIIVVVETQKGLRCSVRTSQESCVVTYRVRGVLLVNRLEKISKDKKTFLLSAKPNQASRSFGGRKINSVNGPFDSVPFERVALRKGTQFDIIFLFSRYSLLAISSE